MSKCQQANCKANRKYRVIVTKESVITLNRCLKPEDLALSNLVVISNLLVFPGSVFTNFLVENVGSEASMARI